MKQPLSLGSDRLSPNPWIIFRCMPHTIYLYDPISISLSRRLWSWQLSLLLWKKARLDIFTSVLVGLQFLAVGVTCSQLISDVAVLYLLTGVIDENSNVNLMRPAAIVLLLGAITCDVLRRALTDGAQHTKGREPNKSIESQHQKLTSSGMFCLSPPLFIRRNILHFARAEALVVPAAAASTSRHRLPLPKHRHAWRLRHWSTDFNCVLAPFYQLCILMSMTLAQVRCIRLSWIFIWVAM